MAERGAGAVGEDGVFGFEPEAEEESFFTLV